MFAADDVALLRRVLGSIPRDPGAYSAYRDGRGYPSPLRPDLYFDALLDEDAPQVGLRALLDGPVPRVGETVWYPVDSVREGVDVLVALGVLPAEMSSAYAAGWSACLERAYKDARLAEVARLRGIARTAHEQAEAVRRG